jgi:hypothetical protein
MKRMRSALGAIAIATIAGAAAMTTAGAQKADSSGGTVAAKIDADAVNALEKMGTYLRTLKTFQVKATVSTEDVLDDGQKVQSTKRVDLVAQRPNRMRVEISDEREPRTFYYDGKSFTLWAPTTRFYATVDAPGTINELVNQLDEKYDIDVPFVDLFRWGTPEADVRELTSATDMGPSAIDGVTCEQYLFRQDGLDWQIWIQNGEFPLPRKLVITTTTDEARPQHQSVYTWNLAPAVSDDAFTFTAPPGAKKINLAEARAKGLVKPEKQRNPQDEDQ